MIIKTILDTDLYKFTTSYAYIKLFPYAMGRFSFTDRDETEYTEEFLEELKAEINNLRELRLSDTELEYMTRNCRFLPRVYWEWLSSFRFNPDKIEVSLDEDHHLHIVVAGYRFRNKEQVPGIHCRPRTNLLQAIREGRTLERTATALLGIRYAQTVFGRCARSRDRLSQQECTLLHRYIQLLFRHEVRHKNDGYTSPRMVYVSRCTVRL